MEDPTNHLISYSSLSDYDENELSNFINTNDKVINWSKIYEHYSSQTTALGFFMKGYMHHFGRGVEHNYKQAFTYYETSMEKGNVIAINNIGVMYGEGEHVKQSYERAVHHYIMASERGNVMAASNCAIMYHHGRGVKQDIVKAIFYYEMAVEKGDNVAMFRLGCLYHYSGMEKLDYEKAIFYYEISIEHGSGIAMVNLKQLLKGYTTNDYIKKIISLKKENRNLKKRNKKLEEENEILNLLPDAPGYHEAKERFDASAGEPPTEADYKK